MIMLWLYAMYNIILGITPSNGKVHETAYICYVYMYVSGAQYKNTVRICTNYAYCNCACKKCMRMEMSEHQIKMNIFA